MRRLLLAAAGGVGLLLAPAGASDKAPLTAERVVAIDWGLVETLLAIGAPPLGVPETRGYRQWVKEPPLPPDVAEIGLRTTPNLAYLAALRPDVILTTPQFASIEPVLEEIAPVLSLSIYTPELQPYDNAVGVTRRLGALTGHQAEAEALIEDTEAALDALEAELTGSELKDVLILSFVDDRHVDVYSEGSIYDDVLERVGLENAWTAPGNFWGFALASIDQFAGMEDTAVLIVEPVPEATRLALQDPGDIGLLAAIPLFDAANRRILPPVWAFGGLPSAQRFAEVLIDYDDFLRAGDED